MVREIEEMVQAISHLATAADPLARSLTPEQIDRLFDLIEKERERQSRERSQSRTFLVVSVAFVLSVVCFLWITALSYSRPELASDLLKVVSGILMGLLGGYGIGGAANRARRRS
jgi:uncharacterized membrane protein